MIQHSKETFFNSKELNKFLPSYLIGEIDEEKEKKVLNKILDIFPKNENVKNNIYNINLKSYLQNIINSSFINNDKEKSKNYSNFNLTEKEEKNFKQRFLNYKDEEKEEGEEEEEEEDEEDEEEDRTNSISLNIPSELIKNNQQFYLNNYIKNIPQNLINNINNYSFINHNNILLPNNINNYNSMNDKIKHNNINSNLLFPLSQIKHNNNIDLINNVNNNKLYNINNMNQNNTINIINNLNNIINYNPKVINTSNLNQNIKIYNILNQLNNNSNNNINNINFDGQINNLKNNNFYNLTKIKKNKNNKYDFLSSNENNCKNDNDSNIKIEDLIKFLKTLSVPLINFLCTPKGTMEIQQKLSNSNNECKLLFVKLLNQKGLSTIMKNIYGNYFFQQFIKKAEKNIISLIISYISTNFIDISKDSSGTFSIQALISEISSVKEEKKILNYIENHEMEMAFNKNATYVLQKIVLFFPDIHRSNLNDIILNNFKELCLDSNGICLIKNFIKTNTLANDKIRINEAISENFVVLAESPFGNYGIQLLMDLWEESDLNIIKKKIMKNILKLSIQQFSSNVIEKAIDIFDSETKEKLIKQLCFDNNNIIILLKNKYGRFVLNKAISYMKVNLKKEFQIYLINNINNNFYSHKDKNKIRRFLIKLNISNLNNDYIYKLNNEFCVKINGIDNIDNLYNNNYISQYIQELNKVNGNFI